MILTQVVLSSWQVYVLIACSAAARSTHEAFPPPPRSRSRDKVGLRSEIIGSHLPRAGRELGGFQLFTHLDKTEYACGGGGARRLFFSVAAARAAGANELNMRALSQLDLFSLLGVCTPLNNETLRWRRCDTSRIH
jgi:hypothetical protein